MGLIKDLFSGLIDLGLFITFGIPAVIFLFFLFTRLFCESNFFSFAGRIGRKQYLVRSLIAIGIVFASLVLMKSNNNVILLLGMIAIVASIVYCSANTVKRLHDMNQSGWWIIAIFAITFLAKQSPETDLIFTSAINIFLISVKGTSGPNKYGENPLIENDQIIQSETPVPAATIVTRKEDVIDITSSSDEPIKTETIIDLDSFIDRHINIIDSFLREDFERVIHVVSIDEDDVLIVGYDVNTETLWSTVRNNNMFVSYTTSIELFYFYKFDDMDFKLKYSSLKEKLTYLYPHYVMYKKRKMNE